MAFAATKPIYGTSAYHAGHRLSAKGIVVIAAAHIGGLGLLASLDVLPMPAPLATLVVEVLPPAAHPPAPEVSPRPKPAERTPAPQPKPMPPSQPRTLAAQTAAPSAAAEVPVANEAPPSKVASAPAPVTVPVTQPRFDAEYLSNPAPVYPAMSRRLGEEGRVLLRVFVEPSGHPSQVEVKAGSGSPRLDQAAQEAVWRWKFIPARRGDEAVGAWVQVPINFNLKG
ncbi:MAG TPA: TonB family protein [Rhodocyclaceae bacterium]|nr:TonB family protein [Rhodocyclaceae bacterium]